MALAVVPALTRADAGPDTGRAVYLARCASCHGERGKPPPGSHGLPDLTDCREATGPTADWRALDCEYMEGAPWAW